MQHYKKCRKTRTNTEKVIKSLAKLMAKRENKIYKSAEIYVWNDCSIAFLHTNNNKIDILTYGKKASDMMKTRLDPDTYERYKMYSHHKRIVDEIMKTNASEYEPVIGKIIIDSTTGKGAIQQ